MQFYFANSYPRSLVEALSLIHKIPNEFAYEFERRSTLKLDEAKGSIIFLVDYQGKGVEVKTKVHFENGCRVFVFKMKRNSKIQLFDLCLTTLRLWSKIVKAVEEDNQPFIYSYSYGSNGLKKVA